MRAHYTDINAFVYIVYTITYSKFFYIEDLYWLMWWNKRILGALLMLDHFNLTHTK